MSSSPDTLPSDTFSVISPNFPIISTNCASTTSVCRYVSQLFIRNAMSRRAREHASCALPDDDAFSWLCAIRRRLISRSSSARNAPGVVVARAFATRRNRIQALSSEFAARRRRNRYLNISPYRFMVLCVNTKPNGQGTEYSRVKPSHPSYAGTRWGLFPSSFFVLLSLSNASPFSSSKKSLGRNRRCAWSFAALDFVAASRNGSSKSASAVLSRGATEKSECASSRNVW